MRKLTPTFQCLVFLVFTHPIPAATQGRIGTFSCDSIHQLAENTGGSGATCIVLGYAQPGDGGGGTFFWSRESTTLPNGGTVVEASGGGFWIRLFDGPLHAAWFGVFALSKPNLQEVKTATERLQLAFDAAAGGILQIDGGTYYVSETLIIPGNTRVGGAGPQDVSTWRPGGTILRPYGPGNPLKWQDTGNTEDDTFRPLLVFAGSNIRLQNMGLQTVDDESSQTDCWEVGVLLPATKRCKLEDVSIQGRWKTAACLLDATWSDRHKEMISLHGGKIIPSSMNECTILRCFLSGKWGLMIRGANIKYHDPRDFRDYENKGAPNRMDEWLWSYGGTSDIEVISCRIEGKAEKRLRSEDGGAYFSDAPMVNSAGAGQGHRFFGCNFRTGTKYMIKLGASNRDSFFGCYFEGGFPEPQPGGDYKEEPSLMQNDPTRTGQTRFVDCRFAAVDTEGQWDEKNTKRWP